jgi:hypothetical protein
MSTYGKTDLEQVVVNHRKVARAVIRLKHSIAADNELNRAMPLIERRLEAMLQQGRIEPLSAEDILAIAESA